LKAKTKIVLLPGMDGTGLLFKPFIKLLSERFEAIVISYPTTKFLDYGQLVGYVKKRLPKASFILLAESFSGPIAYQLGLDKELKIKRIIFVASFISKPNPRLLSLLKFLPLSILLRFPIPQVLIKHFCFGDYTSHKLIGLFRESIRIVSTSVLTQRLKILQSLKFPTEKLNITCLNIGALDDRLLSLESLKEIENSGCHVETFEVNGPHFLLQARPALILDRIMQHEGQ
jgi:pimeloyl-ACP methyl ester carboxylesterase